MRLPGGPISAVLTVLCLFGAPPAHAQSTATLQGTVTDAQSAVLPGVSITIRNTATGAERSLVSGATGEYVAASLPPGHYQVRAHLDGFQDQTREIDLDVAQTVVVNLRLGIGAIAEDVTVTGVSPLIDTATVSVGHVMAERTVQEIPLNGRHFVDLGPLMPGGITPPQNANLSAPLRGQGSFSFFSAGNRETAVNFMINGINLNDLSNSQITFQPSINTVSEFKVDNSTFSAEYGRNSGVIVNVATRSGTNSLHGEAFDFYRDDKFDSRNYFNTPPAKKSPFNRKQFGLNLGGPIVKNRTFYFGSYEGLRHLQEVDLNSGVLTNAQRAAVTDPMSQRLLPYIPQANNADGTRFIGTGTAPVDLDQYTLDVRHNVRRGDDLHGYYAFQRDIRQEPNAQGNTVPGFGDRRGGHRQVMTLNETHIFSERLVNEARFGFNRINISFNPLTIVNPADLGISNGLNVPIALPQITIQGPGLNIGGPAGFPSGREVTTFAAGDTATYLHGSHVIKFGGEFRRVNHYSFNQDPGSFTYPSVTAFQNGFGSAFSITLGDRSYTAYVNSIGAFVQDGISLGSNVKLDVGLRYDYLPPPTEKDNKLVVFDAATDSLVRVGSGIDEIHKAGSDVQPRFGVIWNPTGDGRFAIRGAYAVTINQTNTGYFTGATANPPLVTPLQVSAAGTAASNVRLDNALAAAKASGLSPTSTNPNFQPARMQTWNVNVEREIGPLGLMVGYFGSYGDRQRISLNINQFVNGVRPFPTLSLSSPILPGAPVSNITEVNSIGWSHYKGLWVTATHRMTHGLQFSGSYTLSKSTDTNSFDAGIVSQNSYDIADSEGPSDFDVRHRFAINATYELPFKGNRLAEGWQVVWVTQIQSGGPFNVVTNISTFTGVNNTLRPDLIGDPAIVGSPNQWFNNTVCDPRVPGSCTASSVFALPVSPTGVFHFGNLGRNALIGPGFSNTDLSLVKNIRVNGGARVQLRVEAFNVFNQTNFGQPGRVASVGSTSFGVISSTRFPTGDSGSARQIQFAAKFLF